VKTTDPTLQAAAEAFYGARFPAYIDGAGDVMEACRPAEFFTAGELEQLLTVVRAAIAAPVLALHAPRCGRCIVAIEKCDGHAEWRGEELRHDPAPECTICVVSWGDEATEPWPCPTVRALGVTG
jgi:hypothetical protein